jgi:glucose uptake protein GlcU
LGRSAQGFTENTVIGAILGAYLDPESPYYQVGKKIFSLLSVAVIVLGNLSQFSAISFLGVSEATATTLVVDRGITAIDNSGIVTFDPKRYLFSGSRKL